eukprot:TRINITY_DN7302_c0_g1_i1.p1 TRINITY_DN7302_c0_g1~~TRINITY_DN7302_c0_g1_i1.p1  ORF type:complete len:134 (-),score=36.37 TRINITY_DN7302_c0_g1_i1:246-647(-)
MSDKAAQVITIEDERLEEALTKVIRDALVRDCLARGLRETVKTVDRGEAVLCVLSDSVDESSYTDLVKALCQEAKVHLLIVSDSEKLGEMAQLCRYDVDNNARKVVGCGTLAIKRFGTESTPEVEQLLNAIVQ